MAREKDTIVISGLTEMIRAFDRAVPAQKAYFREALRKVAVPVSRDISRLATEHISRLGKRGARMRIGITTRLVYVAPAYRGVRPGSPLARPNFAPLMGAQMEEALREDHALVERELERVFSRVERKWSE